MYSFEQLQRGIRNPHQALRELNRLFWTRGHRRDYNPDGADFLAEDWDNLVILDGCRYDAFEELLPEYDLEGDLQRRTSRGSATWEFLRGNFHGKRLDDVVYVTASTILYQGSVFREDIDVELHDVVDVWTSGIEYGDDGTPPWNVAREARAVNEEYPNKRLVIHFVQPHAPYLGELGREEFPDFRPNPLSERFRGLIDTPEETLRAVYRENLALVLDEVEELVPELTGKTVITADHGMLLGEREKPFPIKSFGHPGNIYVDEMVTVPWFVIEGERRKRIVAGSAGDEYAKKRTDQLDEKARDHLEQMGYL
ncbi:MAG: hypothetical protein ACOCSP_02545 [archaeon]